MADTSPEHHVSSNAILNSMRTISGTAEAEGRRATRGVPPRRCRAVVITCIDDRFVEPLRDVLAGHGFTGAHDLLAGPGGAVAFPTSDGESRIAALALARDLHDPLEVILVAHHDWGRLGGSASFRGHQAEIATLEHALMTAGAMVAAQFPELHVREIRLDFDGAHSVCSAPSARALGGSVR